MGIQELEYQVKTAIEKNTFRDFVTEMAGGINTIGQNERQVLWTAVTNTIGAALYDSARQLYGSEPGFRVNGLLGLQPEQAIAANRHAADAVELYSSGLDILQQYELRH